MQTREGFKVDRLRPAEWIVGVASLLLLIDLLAFRWYDLNSTFRATSAQLGGATSATGWQAHGIIGPLVLLTCLLGLGMWWAQATCRSPAIPVCLTVITTPFAFLSALCLLIRVVFAPPDHLFLQAAAGVRTQDTLVPAVLGVFLAIAALVGCWLSLRTDGVAAADAPQRIETLALRQRSA